MKIHPFHAAAKILLLILAIVSTVSPCFAQPPALTFSQIMIPTSYDRCNPHLTAAFGEVGYTVEQSGVGWVMAIKGNNRAVMICGSGDNKENTQLTVVISGPPGKVADDKNRLLAEMQSRSRR